MFGFFKKKKNKKDVQVEIGSNIASNQVIKEMTAKADKTFTKPQYNPETRKTHYDDLLSHKKIKEEAFSNGKTVKDPYTYAELQLTMEEAKMKFGEKWQEHLAEADHIEPLNKIVKRSENNPWITTEDIKNIANDEENFQIISRRTNQTGGKGGSTQTEWSQNYKKMQEISQKSGVSAEDVSRKIFTEGKRAEKRNTEKLVQASLKNVGTTAHTAGTQSGVNSAGNAATISGIYNIVSCINGEKTASEALKDIGADSSKAFLTGYKNGAAVTVLNHTLASSKSDFIAALGKNNVAGNVITTVSVTGATIVKWGNGEISTGECLNELGDKGCRFAGNAYGAVIGQTLLPVPIVGATLGSLAGGILTGELYQKVVQGIQSGIAEEQRRKQELYEAMLRYYAEQNRRKEVQELIQTNTEQAVLCSLRSIIHSREFQQFMREAGSYFRNYAEVERNIAECVLVTLQLQEHHKQLQHYTDKYFAKYEYCLASAVNFMETSLSMGDYDGAIAGVNQVSTLFGKNTLIKNTDDFKSKIFGNDDISF